MNNHKEIAVYKSITAVLAVTTCLFAILPIYFEISSVMAYNIALAAGLLACGILKISFLRFQEIRQYNWKMFIPFALFIILLGAAMFKNGEIKTYVVSYLFQYFGPVILFVFFVKDRKQLNTVIDVLIIFTGVICLFGFVEFFTKFNIWSLVETMQFEDVFSGSASFERNGLYRIEQSFQQCIPYSSYLLAIAALIWYRFMTNKKKIFRIIYAVVWLLVCVNLVMTYSRVAIILFVILNFIFFLKVNPKITLIVAGITILSGLAILFIGWICDIDFIIHNKYLAVFLDMFNSSGTVTESSTLIQRLAIWHIVPERVNGHWLFGIGENAAREPFIIKSHYSEEQIRQILINYPDYTREQIMNVEYEIATNSIDNNYLFRILEYGITGLVAFISYYAGTVCAVISGLKKKCNTIKELNRRYPLVWYVAVLTVIYLVIWMSVAQMGEFRIYNLIIGMLFAYFRIPETESDIRAN